MPIKTFVIFTLLLLALPGVTPIRAQDVVTQRQDLSQDLFDLERSYRGQLDEYRRYEREYQLAYEQNTKLQTLSSLETLVQATHRVMTTRALVLHTYFRLMRITVLDAEGINTQHKDRLLSSLDEAVARIETHQQLLEKSQNRTALQQAAVEFEPLHENLLIISNYGQTVIQVGRLQNIYDNANVLLSRIEAEDASQLSAAEVSQRQRAINETKTSLQGVQSQLQQANTELEELVQRQADFYDLFYLTDVYDTLSKSIAFLTELR
ncbi:MAG TPA: hypothetical protein VF209_03285 [Patescibacteria group bacterium]